MTIERMRAGLIGLVLTLGLAACGSSTQGGGDDDTGGGGGGDDEQRWELLLPDDTSIVGTSAVQSDAVTIALSESEPAGWSVTFVTDSELSTDDAGYYDSQNETNRVTGTIVDPVGDTCSVGPGADGGDKTFLTFAGTFDDTPAGSGGVVATCFGSGVQASFNVAFGSF